MPLTLKEIKTKFDKWYTSNQVTREKASDDLVFYWLTHWDDIAFAGSQLEYRGEFDMIRSAGRQILADLAENPVQNDFEPINDTPEDMADIADGLYRRDANHNSSIESFAVADQESVVCGAGAWILYTEYLSNMTGDKKQVIRRKPVYEANNNGFWDSNAKKLDKSDAEGYSSLEAYSEDGYKALVEELTGEEIENIDHGSFAQPSQSYVFPWVGGEGQKIYVVEFYHREKVKEKIVTLQDPFGQTQIVRERSLTAIMDELIDQGFEIVDEKKIDAWEVRKYIASGSEILNGERNSETEEREGERIAGQNIPVVPQYGEYAIVEGEQHWEGVTRLAKDPQRMRDFAYSYITDIFSKSPRDKDIYWPEQIAGFEDMYELNGSDNNYPYLLMNRKTKTGEDLPPAAIGKLTAPNIPPALAAAVQLSGEAIREVANPGLPQDIADPDVSGKAALIFEARLDKQSSVYQVHRKHALRRDGEIYASMASEIYDTPRKEKIELPDGTKKEVEIMQYVQDEETGDLVTLNDLRTAEFEVTSKIGPSYTSQKEKTMDRLEKTLVGMQPDDPLRPMYQLQIGTMAEGPGSEIIREQSRKMMILKGWIEPDTDEEKAMLEQSQNAPKEPDAAMVLAKAEQLKGQADIMQEKREGVKMQIDDENTKSGQQIDVFKATTERLKVQVEAQKAGADINKTNTESIGNQLDNEVKVKEIDQRDIETMSNDELFQELLAG